MEFFTQAPIELKMFYVTMIIVGVGAIYANWIHPPKP